MNMQSLTEQLEAAEAANDSAALAALVRTLLADMQPKKKKSAPRSRKVTRNTPHNWAVVEFADGITILKSYYGLPQEFGDAIEGARFMRAKALAGTPYGLAYREHLENVPRVLACRNVEGDAIETERDKAFHQREVSPAWGKCLLDVTLSPNHNANGPYADRLYAVERKKEARAA